jgi:hypothetical protein
MEGKVLDVRENLEASLERLEETALVQYPQLPQEALPAPLQTFLPLSRTIEGFTSALDKETATAMVVLVNTPSTA